MKTIKNTVKGLSVTAAASLIFSGCGGEQTTASQTGEAVKKPQTANAKPAILRFSWWGGENRHEAYLAAIKSIKRLALM